MIEKLLAELSKATVWMPAQVLKDKVGARNTTNVSLRLRDLEKNGSAVSRSRTEAGAKIVEWRHADKVNAGDLPPAGRATKAAPVVQDSLTTEMPSDKECCNAAKVVATTASSHVSELRREIERLKEANYELAVESDCRMKERNAAQETIVRQRTIIDAKDTELGINDTAVSGWLELAKEFECKSIPELRVFINSSLIRIEALKKAKVAPPKQPAQPRRPFSVTGLVGYHAGSDKITLFLDRRLSSKSVTFPANKMAQLVDIAREGL